MSEAPLPATTTTSRKRKAPAKPRKKKDAEPVVDAQEAAAVQESTELREHGIQSGLILTTAPDPGEVATALPRPELQSMGTLDVFKKAGVRRNRYLLALPGVFSLMKRQSGRLGEICKTDTANPVLYIDFPQGSLKLRGTFMHPRNQFITMSIPQRKKVRGEAVYGDWVVQDNAVQCLDVFEELIVFVKAEWIGQRSENPDETPMPMPSELARSVEPAKAKKPPPSRVFFLVG